MNERRTCLNPNKFGSLLFRLDNMNRALCESSVRSVALWWTSVTAEGQRARDVSTT